MAKKPETKSREEKLAEKQAASEDVLLREVDDAVRQDQYATAAKRYGAPAIALLVLGLAAFAGYLFWQGQRAGNDEKRSEQLVQALDQIEARNLQSGNDALQPLIADGSGATKSAAQMLSASLALEQGKKAEAVKLFAAVANDEDAPEAYRSIARIREVASNFDAMKPADIVAKLRPLAVPGAPFFGSAGELLAIAYMEQGQNAEAGTLFASMARDETVPDTIRSRARQLAGLLGVDAIDDVDDVLDNAGGAAVPVAPQPES
ncbi:tetratricopeptide repeat protein [Altererythrobacter aquiaggeris]|uniref:tetratricopeptide repeat protein n=1 Tax=Aestuarierythrobacter aquiaggeris TaxID=1898396 RepID=UPI0030186770